MTHRPFRAASTAALAAAVLGLLAGCGGPKGFYAGAAQQQQQRAAEEAAMQATAGSGGGTGDASLDTPATYERLIAQMQGQKLWFASLAHIDAMEQRWGPSPASMRLRADALRHTGQPAPSRAMYEKLIGTPHEAAGYHGLGLLAGAEGDYARAVQMLQQAQRLRPTDALLLSDLGYAQLHAGRIDEARVPLLQAMQLQPDEVQVQVNLALYLQANRQTEQADALMETHALPDSTREAVRTEARRIRPRAANPLAAAPSSAPTAPAAAPLALQASRWAGPRRIHIGIRAVNGEAASAGPATTPADTPATPATAPAGPAPAETPAARP